MVWPTSCEGVATGGDVRSYVGQRSIATLSTEKGLLQLRVLRFGFLQDGDVGGGVFPQREEILIRSAGLGGVALERVGTGETEMGECAQREVYGNAAMVQKFLKLGTCG